LQNTARRAVKAVGIPDVIRENVRPAGCKNYAVTFFRLSALALPLGELAAFEGLFAGMPAADPEWPLYWCNTSLAITPASSPNMHLR